MPEVSAWLLTQGVLGVTTLVLAVVVWRKDKQLDEARKDNSAEIKALLERVLTVLHANDSQMKDNTKAIEMLLARIP